MNQKNWEEAFIAYGLDASTGRLFRGLTHNLNGVAQSFSMQTELLRMFFGKAEEKLRGVEQAATLEEARSHGRELQEILRRRAALLAHLERDAGIMQEILQRSTLLMESAENPGLAKPVQLRSIIETEIEFMKGDSFFKHRVRKELQLTGDIPPFTNHLLEIHQIIAIFLENAVQALQSGVFPGQNEPAIGITGSRVGEIITLAVADNGPGVESGLLGRFFEPFVGNRSERLGLGLFLAARLAARFQGTVTCESVPGKTIFTLNMPLEGLAVVN